MPVKKLTNTLNSLIDEPIEPLHEEMIRMVEKLTNTTIPLEKRSEQARGARLVEQKIRVEYFRSPYETLFLSEKQVLGALKYMFDSTTETYRNKMTSLLYISRYFRQILTAKKVKK